MLKDAENDESEPYHSKTFKMTRGDMLYVGC